MAPPRRAWLRSSIPLPPAFSRRPSRNFMANRPSIRDDAAALRVNFCHILSTPPLSGKYRVARRAFPFGMGRETAARSFPMDFRRLRYFMQIVEAGSISRASRSLNVAQPALSKSIQWLEGEFETPLLQRSTHGVTTTEGGQRLYEHCQILFKQLERARLDVRKSVERPSGHVTVGMPYSIVKVLTVALLEA